MFQGERQVRQRRIERKDSSFFNWSLDIPLGFHQPFISTHEAMAGIDLHHGRKPRDLAADLRRAFSGIVAGNVKEEGMRRVEEHGRFRIHGDNGHDGSAGWAAASVRAAAVDEDFEAVESALL